MYTYSNHVKLSLPCIMVYVPSYAGRDVVENDMKPSSTIHQSFIKPSSNLHHAFNASL